MYSKSSWGGNVDPYIEVVFVNDTVKPDTDPVVSLLIFEWKDIDLIGVKDPNRPNEVCGFLHHHVIAPALVLCLIDFFLEHPRALWQFPDQGWPVPREQQG